VLKNILDKRFVDELSKNAILKEFSGECTDEDIDDSVSIADKENVI